MKKTLTTLILTVLTLMLPISCGHDDKIELWNDLQIGEDIFHFKLVEFRNEDQIVCLGDQQGFLTLQFTLADGTAITRKHMLQCPEGYHADLDASQGVVIATLTGDSEHAGTYRGISGQVAIERHEFKTSIEMTDLFLVDIEQETDTIPIDNGYLSFDLSIL